MYLYIIYRYIYIQILYVYIYNIQSTKRKLLSLAFGNRSEDTFFSLSTFRRRLLLVFAHINSRVTSINHSSHTRTHKKTLAHRCKGRRKNMGLSRRVFFPPFPRAPRAHTTAVALFILSSTQILRIRPPYVSPTSIIYTGVKIRSRMGRKRK